MQVQPANKLLEPVSQLAKAGTWEEDNWSPCWASPSGGSSYCGHSLVTSDEKGHWRPPARTPGLASLGEQCIPVALGTKASYGSFNKHFQGHKEFTKERVYGRMGWLVASSQLQIGRKRVWRFMLTADFLLLLPPFVWSGSILKQQLLLAPQAYHHSPKSSNPLHWNRSWSKSPVEADSSLGVSQALSRGLNMHLGTQGSAPSEAQRPTVLKGENSTLGLSGHFTSEKIDLAFWCVVSIEAGLNLLSKDYKAT